MMEVQILMPLTNVETGKGSYYNHIGELTDRQPLRNWNNSPKLTGPFVTRSILRDEQGIEAYYNIGITPWMLLTPDIQIVKGAQEHERTGLLVRQEIDTTVAMGLRLQMVF